MAFERFEADVMVHSKLGDDPNVDNNMTADDLKALFDSPMVEFKTWINETLIPALNSFSPESSMALFVSANKPTYSPCLWFRPAGNGTSEMSYIDAEGEVTQLNLKFTVPNGGVTENMIASSAVTPAKLDRTYMERNAPIILREGVHYGSNLPAAGTAGRLFFKKVT